MEPSGRGRLHRIRRTGRRHQAQAVPAGRPRQRGGSSAPRPGERTRTARRPGVIRARRGHNLVGGHRVNEWPTGWFREDKPAAPPDGNAMPGAAGGSAAAGSAAAGNAAAGNAAAGAAGGMPGAANDPTVRLPAGSAAAGSAAAGSAAAGSGAGGSSHGAGGTSYRPGGSGYPAGGSSYASTATGAPANPWPNQPPTRSAPGRLPRGSATYGRGGRRT